MTETDKTSEIERIKNRIHKMVESHFSTGKPTYYLAQMGSQLGDDRLTLERLTGQKLATFLKEETNYNVDSEGLHRNVFYIKSGEATDDDIETFKSIPRYSPSFWAAFAKPLKQDSRFINIDTLRFSDDFSSLGEEGDSIREIKSEFIAPLDESGNASETANRIEQWLKSQKLGAEPFVVKKRAKLKPQRNLMEAVLCSLDGEQLKRSILPLDVVRKLFETEI